MEGFDCPLRPMNQFRDNILSIYNLATPLELLEGALWYSRANGEAKRMAKRYKTSPQVAAGVIAALSPQQEWSQNLRLAERGLKTKKFTGHYTSNTNKARAIYRGVHPETVLKSKWGYQKTLRFYQCIESEGDCDSVCLDRHALAVALGRVATNAEQSRLKGPLYDVVAEAYRDVARELGIRPSTLQAITWVAWKRIKNEETEFDVSKFN